MVLHHNIADCLLMGVYLIMCNVGLLYEIRFILRHHYHLHHHVTTITTLTNLTDGVFSNEQEEKDIISELKVLMHVEAHPNIVCLLGASVNNGRNTDRYRTQLATCSFNSI